MKEIINQTVSPNKHFKLAQQTVHYVQSILLCFKLSHSISNSVSPSIFAILLKILCSVFIIPENLSSMIIKKNNRNAILTLEDLPL